MAEPWSPQPGEWYVAERGRLAHRYRKPTTWMAGTVPLVVLIGRMFCGAQLLGMVTARPAADSDPRCRRCAERGGEERERG